ncbi:MAG: hypothetical protein ACRD3J_08430, partial [Thermoanaerobaculia bacterium]
FDKVKAHRHAEADALLVEEIAYVLEQLDELVAERMGFEVSRNPAHPGRELPGARRDIFFIARLSNKKAAKWRPVSNLIRRGRRDSHSYNLRRLGKLQKMQQAHCGRGIRLRNVHRESGVIR